jgi:hypothetical protein
MLMHREDIRATAEGLRARIEAIDRGELASTSENEIFLRGALEVLNGVLDDVAPGR